MIAVRSGVDGALLIYPINHAGLAGAVMHSPRGRIDVEPVPYWILCVALGNPSLTLARIGAAPVQRAPLIAGCFGLLAPGQHYSARAEDGSATEFAMFDISTWIGTSSAAEALTQPRQGFRHDDRLARLVIRTGLGAISEHSTQPALTQPLVVALGRAAQQAFARVRHAQLDLRRTLGDFASTRLPDAIRVKDMAESMGCSAGHLSRKCARELRSSPYDLVQDARFARASRLLRYTRWPLSQIALECGYCDQSHMTKTFRNRTALTPIEFRNHTP